MNWNGSIYIGIFNIFLTSNIYAFCKYVRYSIAAVILRRHFKTAELDLRNFWHSVKTSYIIPSLRFWLIRYSSSSAFITYMGVPKVWEKLQYPYNCFVGYKDGNKLGILLATWTLLWASYVSYNFEYERSLVVRFI